MTPRPLWCCLLLLWTAPWAAIAQNQVLPFSHCWYASLEAGADDEFNEIGYGAIQKENGEFIVWANTPNRGQVTPTGTTDDAFIVANLDANGQPLNPKYFVHTFQEANKAHRDQLLVEMNPPFNSTPNSPYIAFTNYTDTQTGEEGSIQVTFFNQENECINSSLELTAGPGFKENFHDVIQGENSNDLVIIGDCYGGSGQPVLREFFLYGFKLDGSVFGAKKLLFQSPANPFNINTVGRINAIDEWVDVNGNIRYAITGTIEGRLLFFTTDADLNPDPYAWYDLDGNPNTEETGLDIEFDPNTNTWVVAGTISENIGLQGPRVFVTRINIECQTVWTRQYNLPDGGESVEEMHLLPNGNITIAGQSRLDNAFTPIGARDDRAYLMRLDPNGGAQWVYRYLQADGNEVNDLELCTDGGYMLTGSCWENAPSPTNFTSEYDLWNLKTDAEGRLSQSSASCFEAIELNVTELQGESNKLEVFFEPIEWFTEDQEYACSPFFETVEVCEGNPVSDCSTAECPASSVLNISTGIDAAGNLIPVSSVDPYWQTINLPPLQNNASYPSGISPPNAYAIDPYLNLAWWNGIANQPPNCQQLSVRPGAVFGPNNANAGQPWRLRREFCLCDSSEVQILGNMRADDQGQLFLYDDTNTAISGGPIASTSITCPGGSSQSSMNTDWPINYTTTLGPGTYHLEFELVNCGNAAMGFAVSATVNNVGGQSTISNPSESCCSAGVVTVQKLHDENCDGEVTQGEPGLAGWDFTLTETTTGTTYTGTTDAFGEIVFRQLPYGTYTVTETLLSPWMASNPPNGTTTVTISPDNPVEVVNFLNKNPEACLCIDQTIVPIASEPGECCFELLVDNNYGLYYDEIELVANGFTISSFVNTSGLNPVMSTPTSVKIRDVIPMGNGQSMLTFCTNNLFGTGNATINWYHMGEIVCSAEQEIICEQEENCIEVVTDSIVCNPDDPTLFKYYFTVTNNWLSPNLTRIQLNSPGINFSPDHIDFSPGIIPGGTSAQQCITIQDTSSLATPRSININFLSHDSTFQLCCFYEKEITLPNCCDPCVDDWVALSPDSLMNEDCCYALDVDVVCPRSLTSIQLESLTPGVALTNVAAGGSCVADWTVNALSTQFYEWVPNGGVASAGLCDDLINFCIEDSLYGTSQLVAIHYITTDGMGGDLIACSDTLEFNCEKEPPCLEIVSDSIYCDNMGNYFLDFCVENISDPAFDADAIAIAVVPPTSTSISTVSPTYITVTGLLDHGDTYCGTVQVVSFAPGGPMAGDDLCIELAMHDNTPIPLDTCCFAEETLCVVLPDCEDCCTDPFDFFENILPATQFTELDGNTIQVNNFHLKNCHDMTVVWGDGTTTGPVPASALPLTHTFVGTPGESFEVCVYLDEFGSDGVDCFNGSYCYIFNQMVLESFSLEVAPNPVSKNLDVSSPSGTILTRIRILDTQGRPLHEQAADADRARVKVDQLSKGLYLIEATSIDGEKQLLRFVKE